MPRVSWLARVCRFALLLGLAGCAASPTPRLYVLTPLPIGTGDSAPPVQVSSPIGVYPVRLPAYLDRPEIVTRVDSNRLHLAESEHWGEPLGDGLTRVLVRDLSILLPTARIAVFPHAITRRPEFTVSVEVAQLDAALHQDCTLVARWTVRGISDTESRTGTFIRTEPVGESYGTYVAAVSRLLAGLAQVIAADLRGFAQ